MMALKQTLSCLVIAIALLSSISYAMPGYQGKYVVVPELAGTVSELVHKLQELGYSPSDVSTIVSQRGNLGNTKSLKAPDGRILMLSDSMYAKDPDTNSLYGGSGMQGYYGGSYDPPYPQFQVPSTGNRKMLVLLVEFNDTNHTSGTYEIPHYVDRIFNDTPGVNSVHNYYIENSFNQTFINGTVVNWTNMNYNMSWIGRDGTGIDNYYGPSYRLIQDALYAQDTSINYNDWDTNGDCIIDHVMVVHAGQGQEFSAVGNDIWSVRWGGGTIWTSGDICTANPIYNVRCTSGTIVPEDGQRGVISHEFAHDIGAADLYNTATGFSVVNDWSLMDHGSWMGSPAGSVPVHIDMWHKTEVLNWTQPIIFNETYKTTKSYRIYQTDFNYSEISDWSSYRNNVSVRIDVETNSSGYVKEYFILEHRTKDNYDANSPEYGLLIWHVDRDQSNWWISGTNDVNNYATKGVIEKIVGGGGWSTAPMNVGEEWNWTTTPSTNRNDGQVTNISVKATNNGTGSPKWFEFDVFYNGPELGCLELTGQVVLNNTTTICTGTYYVNTTEMEAAVFINSSNVVLTCNGSTIIGNGTGVGVFANQQTNVSVLGCDIRNYQGNVYYRETNDSLVEGCNFTGVNATMHSSVHLESSNNITIKNTVISGDGYGIGVDDTNNSLFDNITISGVLDAGIGLKDSYNNRIINSGLYNDNKSISIEDSGNITVEGNTFVGENVTGYGVYSENSYNLTIKNNDLSDLYRGIYLYGYLSESGSLIEGNLIEDGYYGILLVNYTGSVLTNNTIVDVGLGMQILSESMNNTAYNNNFTNINLPVWQFAQTSNGSNVFTYNGVGNYWSDISGRMELYDSNWDGFGDTGPAYPYQRRDTTVTHGSDWIADAENAYGHQGCVDSTCSQGTPKRNMYTSSYNGEIGYIEVYLNKSYPGNFTVWVSKTGNISDAIGTGTVQTQEANNTTLYVNLGYDIPRPHVSVGESFYIITNASHENITIGKDSSISGTVDEVWSDYLPGWTMDCDIIYGPGACGSYGSNMIKYGITFDNSGHVNGVLVDYAPMGADRTPCLAPDHDNYQINESLTLCNGVFYINDSDGNGIFNITSSNVNLAGNNTTIIGGLNTYNYSTWETSGILIVSDNTGAQNITIENITASNYYIMLYIVNTSNFEVSNSRFSKIGRGALYLDKVNGVRLLYNDIREVMYNPSISLDVYFFNNTNNVFVKGNNLTTDGHLSTNKVIDYRFELNSSAWEFSGDWTRINESGDYYAGPISNLTGYVAQNFTPAVEHMGKLKFEQIYGDDSVFRFQVTYEDNTTQNESFPYASGWENREVFLQDKRVKRIMFMYTGDGTNSTGIDDVYLERRYGQIATFTYLCSNLTFEDNVFYNAIDGLTFGDNSYDLTIKNNRFFGNIGRNLLVSGRSSNVVIMNNYFNNSLGIGLEMGFTDGALVYNNTFENLFNNTMNLYISKNITIENNTIRDVDGYGLFSFELNSSIVRSNKVYRTTWDAFYIDQDLDTLVEDNYVENISGYYCFFNWIGANNITYRNNICNDSFDAGFFAEGVSNSTYINNYVRNTSWKGFHIHGCDNLLLENNTVSETNYGIGIGTSKGIQLKGNNLYTYNEGVVFNEDTNDSSSIGDKISSGVYYGYNLYTARNITISGANISAHTTGIRMENVSDSLIEDSIISNSSSFGIFIYDSYNNTITRNKIFDNQYGVYIDGTSSNLFYYNRFYNNTKHARALTIGNDFNTSIGGKAHGNFWDDVATLNITDSDGDKFGDGGSQYPYNESNGGNVTGYVTDWGPWLAIPIETQFTFYTGWNLFSIPTNMTNYSATYVLSGISGKYGKVLRFNNENKSYETFNPSYPEHMNDFTEIDYDYGYWISITENCSLDVEGYLIPGNRSYNLTEGWNLVPWASLSNTTTVSDALSSISSDYGKVLRFNTINQSYETFNPLYPPFMNEFTVMTSTRGYWISMIINGEWNHTSIS